MEAAARLALRLHAVSMILAWILFANLGAFIARYCKTIFQVNSTVQDLCTSTYYDITTISTERLILYYIMCCFKPKATTQVRKRQALSVTLSLRHTFLVTLSFLR